VEGTEKKIRREREVSQVGRTSYGSISPNALSCPALNWVAWECCLLEKETQRKKEGGKKMRKCP